MKTREPERLNIGLVVPGFSAHEADWCIPALLNLVRCLASAHDVTVYALRYPHLERRYGVFGARVRSFGGATAGGWRRLPLLRRAITAIIADARRKPYSILHGLWADEAGFVASVAARRSGTPVLVSLMGGELARLPEIDYGVQLSHSGRLLTALSLRLANAVSAGSLQLLDEAAARISRRRLHRLPLGVDLSFFAPAALTTEASTFRIMHAASLTAVKDQNTLLEAFASARSQLAPLDISLHIAGDGPLRPALEARTHELRVAHCVRFLGALLHERLPDFYRQGHLFALSSRHESQSVALLEAAACGLPAVGMNVGLLPELLPARYLAAPGDAQGLAQAIGLVLRDNCERLKEARRLQALVSSRYGLDSTVPLLADVYRRLIVAGGA